MKVGRAGRKALHREGKEYRIKNGILASYHGISEREQEEKMNKQSEKPRGLLSGKTVLLCVTGGIAAYKMPNVARMLKKLGCNVHVLMTQNATNFITATTF